MITKTTSFRKVKFISDLEGRVTFKWNGHINLHLFEAESMDSIGQQSLKTLCLKRPAVTGRTHVNCENWGMGRSNHMWGFFSFYLFLMGMEVK